jgi:hypothetical protein
LTSEEKDILKAFTKRGNAKVNIMKRAQILLFLDENKESRLKQKEIAKLLQTTTTVTSGKELDNFWIEFF